MRRVRVASDNARGRGRRRTTGLDATAARSGALAARKALATTRFLAHVVVCCHLLCPNKSRSTKKSDCITPRQNTVPRRRDLTPRQIRRRREHLGTAARLSRAPLHAGGRGHQAKRATSNAARKPQNMRQLALRVPVRWVDVVTVGSLAHARQAPGVRLVLRPPRRRRALFEARLVCLRPAK